MLTFAILLFVAGASQMDCDALEQQTGGCVAANTDGDTATLNGTLTLPGAGTGPDSNDSGSGPEPITAPAPRELRPFDMTITSPVTLADIAQFHPITGDTLMQPNGWAVAGLPANFFSTASIHSVDGTLLGKAASVRFRPVAWQWSYGDGTAVKLTTPGEPWGSEFDDTPTSHVFRAKGTFTVTLLVEFTAEYRFDAADWLPIAGTVTARGDAVTVTSTSATTVLVNDDCLRNRVGPGC